VPGTKSNGKPRPRRAGLLVMTGNSSGKESSELLEKVTEVLDKYRLIFEMIFIIFKSGYFRDGMDVNS